MRLSPDVSPVSILFFALFVLCMVFVFNFLIRRDRIRNGGESWFNEVLKSLELDKHKDTFILNNSLNNLTAENLLIYTSGESVYIINKIRHTVKEINKTDILKIDLNIYTSQKNVKRLIALTSTYDNKINITGMEFKVITKMDTYVLLMISNGRNVDNITLFDKAKLIDDANRCKLILEDDIKKLNSLKI